jgi:hypothetical protein
MTRTRPGLLHRIVGFAVCVTVALVLASTASATFPGLNGSIAFTRFGPAPGEIVAVDPSGASFSSPLTSAPRITTRPGHPMGAGWLSTGSGTPQPKTAFTSLTYGEGASGA